MELLGGTKKTKLSLKESIQSGRAVPIIGDEVLFDLILDSYASFVACYGEAVSYPLDDRNNLPRVARYRKLAEQKKRMIEGESNPFTDDELRAEYLRYIQTLIHKRAEAEALDEDILTDARDQYEQGVSVTEFAKNLGYPDFDAVSHSPLQVLADQNFRIILTTSPFMFIEQALERVGKQPVTVMCSWRTELDDVPEASIPPGHQLNKNTPLVYHLFGLDKYADSVVLTEDDYLDFLVNVSGNRGDNSRDRLHGLARQALHSDLIVLGYSLNSWAFRALYAGLIKHNQRENRGVCCVQVLPNEDERNYLNDYLQHEAKFEVFWGKVEEYTDEIRSL